MKITYVRKAEYSPDVFITGQEACYDAENVTIDISKEELDIMLRSHGPAADKLSNSIAGLVDKIAKK